MIRVDERTVEEAAHGGAVLGGGGGGAIDRGIMLGRLALQMGHPRILEIDAFKDSDLLATVSYVGAPAATEQYVEPIHFVQAMQVLLERLPEPVAGLMTNENGGVATINGWLQSVVLGLPLADAPCNGRAQPIGIMGAIGLERVEGYIARHGVVGGDPETRRHIRMYVEGAVESTAHLVRQAAVTAGGAVAAARNPVTASFASKNAAPGALRQAIEVGRALISTSNPKAGAEAVSKYLGGQVVCQGRVERRNLRTEGGLDVGTLVLTGGYELTFWNEFMTLEQNGTRLATFPDLIATLSTQENRAVPSADTFEGQDLFVIHVPRSNLILGAGMHSRHALELAERAVGKDIVRFLEGFPLYD